MAERSKRREKKTVAGITATTAPAAPSDAVFREQLYTSFQDKGVVQSLKTQLRERLASDLLRHAAASGQDGGGGGGSGGHKHRRPSKHRAADNGEHRASLSQRLADALLREHLESSSYDYTLSVFMAECGQRHDQFLAMDDVRKLLHVSSPTGGQHASTKRGSTSAQQLKGCLLDIVQAALARHTTQVSSQTTQTEELPRKQLAERMADLEVSFSKRQSLLESGVEAQMLSFQNKCREQCNEELLRYKSQYAATELAKVQLEERRRYDEKLQAVRREYEDQHRGGLQALQVREQESSLALQRRQQDLEGELYRQRQNLLEQIEHLRKKELEVQQGAASNEQKLQSQMLRLERDREQVDKDQLRHKQESENFQQRVQAEVQRCQLRMEQELQEKTIRLEAQQGSLKERDEELLRRSKTFESLSSELSSARERLLETQEKLHHAIENHHDTVWQRDRLQEIVSEVKDYSSLKEQVALLQRELESANRRAADARDALNQQQKGHQSLVKELSTKLSLTSPEVALLKDELEHAKDGNRRHALVAKETQHMLMQRLQHEAARSDDAARQLQELQIREKSLQLEVEDLRRLLAQAESALARPSLHADTQRAARLTRKSFARTGYANSNSETSADDGLRAKNHLKPLKPSSIGKALLATAPSSTVADASDSTTSDHWSLRLDTTSHRQYFKELEREAEELERSYNDFQLRLEGRQPVASAGSFLPTFSEQAAGAMASLHLHDAYSSSHVAGGWMHPSSTGQGSFHPQRSPVRAPQRYQGARGTESIAPAVPIFSEPVQAARNMSSVTNRASTAAPQPTSIDSSAGAWAAGGGVQPASAALHPRVQAHTPAVLSTHCSEHQTATEGSGRLTSRHAVPEVPAASGTGAYPERQASSFSLPAFGTANSKPSASHAVASGGIVPEIMPAAAVKQVGLAGVRIQHQVSLDTVGVGQDMKQASEQRREVDPKKNQALQSSQHGLQTNQKSSMSSSASIVSVQPTADDVKDVPPTEESLHATSLEDVSVASVLAAPPQRAGDPSRPPPGHAALEAPAGARGALLAGDDSAASSAASSPSRTLPTFLNRAWSGGTPEPASRTPAMSSEVSVLATAAATAASGGASVPAVLGSATALTSQGRGALLERYAAGDGRVLPATAVSVPGRLPALSLDGARTAESSPGDARSESAVPSQTVTDIPATRAPRVASEPMQAATAARTASASMAEVATTIGVSARALVATTVTAPALASKTSSGGVSPDVAMDAAALQAERRREQRLRKEREDEERLLAEQEALEQLLRVEQEQAERQASHSGMVEASLDADSSLSEISFGDKSSASTGSSTAGKKGGDDVIDSSMLAYMKLVQDKRAAEASKMVAAPTARQNVQPSAGATLPKQPDASPAAERWEQSAKKEKEDWSLPEDSEAGSIKGLAESDNSDSEW